MQSEPLGQKEFLRWAAAIALPAMVQNLISTLVSSADTLMLGYVSQDAMSASSLANQLPNVLTMAFYGLTAGVSVLTAQYWGRGDRRTIERVMGLALRFTLSISLVFFLAAFCFPGFVMRLFTDEVPIINEGIKYLRIVSFSYLFMGVSQIYVSALRSIEKVALPTAIYIMSLCINVLLNATFIFGLFGLPKLGLTGVALGTVTARFAECVVCFIHSRARSEIKLRIKYILGRAGVLTKDFLKLSFPSMINDIMWSLAMSMFSSIMGHLGSDAVAANAVAVMAVNIGAIACRGFAGATTIIVSKALGAGSRDNAILYSKRMLLLTLAFGTLGCGVILLIRPLVTGIYADKLTENALLLLNSMFICRAVQLIGEGINTCLICGCFRGGGDAVYGMYADTLLIWLLTVPLALIAAYVIKLPPIWVYAVICVDEFEKMPFFFAHYFRFRWLRDLTRSQSELEV